MRPTDTVARLTELLAGRLTDGGPDGGEGEGLEAKAAWAAFKQMAAEPADEPFDDAYGSGHLVAYESLMFEASVSDGWTREDGSFMPRALWLSFLRQFDGGEANEGLFGPELSIWYPLQGLDPALPDELVIWGEPASGDRIVSSDVDAWVSRVETCDVFVLARDQLKAAGFNYGMREVG